MPDHPHAFLIDLLAMQDAASSLGCGLEPRLLELLLDRHATHAGIRPLECPIRADGPPQTAPQGMARAGTQPGHAERCAHARH
ncbi:MAG: hypothetical protein JJU19_12040 [Pararhodobacter sp.]|nr:hypothetical protein [Pararhodobacter sp.]